MFPLRGVYHRDDGSVHPAVSAAMQDIKALMLSKTRDEWLEIIPRDLTVVPMLEYGESLESDYARERGMVWELDHPLEGKVRQLGSPFRLSETPPAMRNFAPVLGASTEEVLQGLGYSHAEISDLERDGVIRIARPRQ